MRHLEKSTARVLRERARDLLDQALRYPKTDSWDELARAAHEADRLFREAAALEPATPKEPSHGR